MKYDRFRLYDFRLLIWNRWKLCLILIVFIGILLQLLYHIPIVTEYNQTFSGFELHYDSDIDPTYEYPEVVKNSVVRFEGKLYRYLWKEDYFEGLVYFDDFTTSANPEYKISDTEKIYFANNDLWMSNVTNPLWGTVIERGENERIYYAFVNFKKDSEFFAFLISTVHDDGNGWSSGDKYIVVPAESSAEAAAKYHKNVWQKMQDDISSRGK